MQKSFNEWSNHNMAWYYEAWYDMTRSLTIIRLKRSEYLEHIPQGSQSEYSLHPDFHWAWGE